MSIAVQGSEPKPFGLIENKTVTRVIDISQIPFSQLYVIANFEVMTDSKDGILLIPKDETAAHRFADVTAELLLQFKEDGLPSVFTSPTSKARALGFGQLESGSGVFEYAVFSAEDGKYHVLELINSGVPTTLINYYKLDSLVLHPKFGNFALTVGQ